MTYETDRELACELNETRRIAALRMELLEAHPFWGHLLMQLRLQPAPQLPTLAATDCHATIWYNPRLTRHLPLRQLGFVLLHEVGHCALESMSRHHGRDMELWNCATDYAINRLVASIRRPDTPEAMYDVPSGKHPELGEIHILLDARYDGMVSEAIYQHLLEAEEPRQGVVLAFVLPDGSEVEVNAHYGGIDVHLPAELTEEQRESLAERVSAALEAWQQSEKRGDLPAGFERAFSHLRGAHVPWPQLLARYVGQATARDDYSLTRPHRRWLEEDVIVPGLHSNTVQNVVVAVDTSGSMTASMLQRAAAELAKLHAYLGDVTVLSADAKVQQVVPAAQLPAFLQKGSWRGGGGTDHRPVFDWLGKQQQSPDLFIGITDLQTSLPTQRPHFPVLWLVPEKHPKPRWGQVLVMKID